MFATSSPTRVFQPLSLEVHQLLEGIVQYCSQQYFNRPYVLRECLSTQPHDTVNECRESLFSLMDLVNSRV